MEKEGGGRRGRRGGRERVKEGVVLRRESRQLPPTCSDMGQREDWKLGSQPAVLLAGSSALTEDVTTLMLLNFLNSKPGLIICLCTVVASLAKPHLVMCTCAFLPRVELACPPHPSGEQPFRAFSVGAQVNCAVLLSCAGTPPRASSIVKNVQQNGSKDGVLYIPLSGQL